MLGVKVMVFWDVK